MNNSQGTDADRVGKVRPAVSRAPDGVCKLLDAETIAASPGAAWQARQQAFDVLAQGLELSVSVCTTPGNARACAQLACACEVLAYAAEDAGVSKAQLQLVIENPDIRPKQAAAIRRTILGKGLVFVVAGDAALPSPASRARAGHGFWRELWQARDGGTLRVAYGSRVRASSPLLRSEAATAVLPQAQLEVPADTAWIQYRIDLSAFDDDGEIRQSALGQVLRSCVEQGERAHDGVCWATPQMRDDAWLNRRLAIGIHGIGDLVARSGRDPRAFSTLEYLGRVLQSVRRILQEQTRAVARRTANLPALEQSDPCRFLPPGELRNAWARRWKEMLTTAAVRHRNLLALSPWSVFPTGQAADFRYADLLPTLRYADTCMLSGMPDIRHWKANNFRQFHCRAGAALQQRESPNQIAEEC